jgi:hypothetical protein
MERGTSALAERSRFWRRLSASSSAAETSFGDTK